ncbi:gp029 [Rhodococcus phage ReqiDocB7]|uniref:gp029 n=1 Tax=Rhodococcus phage ReqiDocB7 TaxID=691966 RepID=UPI0001CDD75F|nr:gp029 [Rhodococcus phage ReqiDocB7]ADD80815.1 gp029 [Rhodococcus phage ReqiDocB7]
MLSPSYELQVQLGRSMSTLYLSRTAFFFEELKQLCTSLNPSLAWMGDEMEWPWSRKRNREREPSREVLEARAERKQAQSALEATAANTSSIINITEKLESSRRRNHYGEAIELAWIRKNGHATP